MIMKRAVIEPMANTKPPMEAPMISGVVDDSVFVEADTGTTLAVGELVAATLGGEAGWETKDLEKL